MKNAFQEICYPLMSFDLFKQGVAWHASRGKEKAGSMVGLFFTVWVFAIFIFYTNMRFQTVLYRGDVNVEVLERPRYWEEDHRLGLKIGGPTTDGLDFRLAFAVYDDA
jgi:hypothetical protein